MPDEQRDRYLDELGQLLPFPPERRAEIIEEISAHLDDAVAERMDRGVPVDRAEADAQARLGVPRHLARDMARPEQSARRLLAAAGSGVWAGVGPGLYGFFFGLVLLFVLSLTAAGVVQLVSGLMDRNWTLQTSDGGWNTLMMAGAVALGLYFAGRAIAEAVAVASRRLYADVRVPVALSGTLLAGIFLTLVIDVPQNAASVIGLAAAPLAFGLGAVRPGLLPRRFLASWLVFGTLAVLLPLSVLLLAGGSVSGGVGDDSPVIAQATWERRLEAVGPWWGGEQTTAFSNGWGSTERGTRGYWEVADARSLSGLTDLRAEAWRSDPETLWLLDARYAEPFAMASVVRDGSTLTADVITTAEPGVSHWELVLTGLGPDGVRYVVAAGSAGTSTFTGSVWDWVVAVSD